MHSGRACNVPGIRFGFNLPSFLFHPPRPANPASLSSRVYSFVLSVLKSSLLFKAEPTGNVSLWPALTLRGGQKDWKN